MEEELTGIDYVNEPLTKLMSHPDYSAHAHRIVERVLSMTTAQLEELIVTGDTNGR